MCSFCTLHLSTHSTYHLLPRPPPPNLFSCLCPQIAWEAPGQILHVLLLYTQLFLRSLEFSRCPGLLEWWTPLLTSFQCRANGDPVQLIAQEKVNTTYWFQIQGRISDFSFWGSPELREQTEAFLWLGGPGHADQGYCSITLLLTAATSLPPSDCPW